MDYSDDDTDSTTSSVDVFADLKEEDPYEIEDIFLRDGTRQQPSNNNWTYQSFSERGCDYSGSLKNSIINEDDFQLRYNYIENILYDKMKVELDRTMNVVYQDLHDTGKNSTITPFAAFAAVCPEEFFVLFHKWLKCGITTTAAYSLPEIVEFWRCELIMSSLELSQKSLKNKVSQNEYGVYELVKNTMFRADRPPSTRTSVFGVSKLPPFSFDPIIDNVISSNNKLCKSFLCSWCHLG